MAEAFGANVSALRRARELSQADLAGQIGAILGRQIDPTAITRIESGRRQVTLEEALAIAASLEVSVSELAKTPAHVELIAVRDIALNDAGAAHRRIVEAVDHFERTRRTFVDMCNVLAGEPFNFRDEEGVIGPDAWQVTVDDAVAEGRRRAAGKDFTEELQEKLRG